MSSNLDKFKSDLDALAKLGDDMHLDLSLRHLDTKEELDADVKKVAKKLKGKFEDSYQRWYTEASAVIEQVTPGRLLEFQELYRGDGKRKDINSITYCIQDWLNGIRAAEDYAGDRAFNDFAIVSMRLKTQLEILKAANARFESSLLDIKQLVQADIFDSELDEARELLKRGFKRASGAVAGVVLERHLAQVADNHNISTRKKAPTIADFNDLLKKGSVFDVPLWRNIQRLADIRNLCDHNKDRDPTDDEVQELVDGVEKITKTLF